MKFDTKNRIALFGTSADPPTNGHKKILEELSNIYSCVITYASDNPKKKHKENIFFRNLLLKSLIKDINNPKIIFNQKISSQWAIESIVVPSGALGGEGVLACIERGLNIISVKNKNILNLGNHNLNYPKLIEVDNYFEAAGLILAIRKGINLRSIKRPLNKVQKLNYKK